MSRVVAVAPALPGPAHDQGTISEIVAPLVTGSDAAAARLLRRVHAASGVATRHLALAPEEYAGIRDFGHANDLYLRVGTDLAERAAADALARAGVAAHEVDLILFTSVTGIGAPSVDVSLVRRLGMRTDVRRMPSFGWGCGGGAAGLARVHDYLAGHPHDTALLVCLELCSLTLQHGDRGPASLVASGLFGDGAAAAVVVGEAHPAAPTAAGPQVVATRSRLYAGTEGALGWQIGSSGFRIVLSSALPDVIRTEVGADVEGLLAAHGLKVDDVTRWVVHAGGPRILDAVGDALGLAPEALDASRASLAAVGNLSSASVLDVLDRTLRDGAPPGSAGVLVSFGPGVSAETVLLRWSSTEG
ncbi:type III polyketide synthase [Cellulomonas sp. KH9]|uniref:type III polyketide synthase n=1 Tax=Cellulomonas sp. KH9 TaxID=1855324 RepID=UPI0008EBE80A|nr:3-oxoacyl-[acyl-carrier-protein] synthase III C-terminal domain-containing protein [Cellulomonas sp. KH9]SFK28048.1 isopalmitoylresorcinol synthase [Cellulomonas sp. KH9]